MVGEWRDCRLGDVARIYDGPHATPKTVESGPVFLGIDTLDCGRLNLAETRHVSEEDFITWTRRVQPQPGDIVFSYETRIGQAAMIPEGLRCCLGRRLALIRVDEKKVNNRFLLFQYLSPGFQDYLRAHTVPGSTVDRLHLKEVPSFSIKLPPRDEQDRIADVLGFLDDKVELNRRTARTLEEVARALFKSWCWTSSEIARLAASDLERAGVLQINDGYRAKNDEFWEAGLPFVRAANLKNGINLDECGILGEQSISKIGNKLSRIGDVAFTSKGTVGRFARVGEHLPNFVYSPQICFWRSLDPEKLHPATLYCWMQDADFQRQIYAASEQTDMAPYVSLADQRRMKVPVFGEDQASFGEQVQPFLTRQSLLAQENRTLAGLRDALLPKLISGELRIQDAEALVEEAA